MGKNKKQIDKEFCVKQYKRHKLELQQNLNYYTLLEQEIKDIEEELLGVQAQTLSDMPRGGGNEFNSKTEQQALRLSARVQNKRETIRAVEKLYDLLTPKQKLYFDLRYINKYSQQNVCIELSISQIRYFKINKEILKKFLKAMGYVD